LEPNFLPERSSVENVNISGPTPCDHQYRQGDVQLRTRHWIITDASGPQAGSPREAWSARQPVLAPGERFEYTSGVPLPTASGFMTGRYQDGERNGEGRDRRADLLARQSRQQAVLN